MKARAAVAVLLVGFFISNVFGGSVELAGEGFIPEPNEEVTVYVHTEASLLCMGVGIQISGDANITTAMCEADCNNYGWDNGWNSDPYIDDANNWLYIGGVSWPCEATGTVGYFKFRYHSGEVVVSITPEYSDAFDANCEPVSFSNKTLVFGEPDPNDSSKEEDSSSQDTITDENTSAVAANPNDINLPVNNYWQDKLAQRQKHLIHCPAGFDSDKEIFNKADLEEQFKCEKDDGGQMLLDGEPNVIEINSDITTNQIWTANNVYWVTSPIQVQALLVIEPGTMVIFGDDYGYYDCGIYVNNGGTLISKGAPDNPIIYTCDFMYPDWGYYFEYVGDYGNYYFCPIYIEHTASPATTVTYNFIEGAVVGIVTENIPLDHPIENNHLFGNLYGIGEYGTKLTDIKNNLCYYNYYSGIDVHLADVNDVGDANSVITIANNTCDTYQDNGITVHGVTDESDSGLVMLLNNIVSQSYAYGLNLVDGYMIGIVSNTGYYGNPTNKNWEFDEDNPVIATQNPFVSGSGYFDLLYLDQNCPFINAGLEYIEQTHLIGTSTDVNSLPDSNFVDIGFHHPDWGYSNAGTGFAAGDFNKDTITDYEDLYTLITNWLDSVTIGSSGDLNNDGSVNFKDYTIFAATWQKIQGEPNISPVISGDPNSGYVNVGVNGFASDTQRIFLLADGKYAGEIFAFQNGDTIETCIAKSGNQEQELKLIGINSGGQITCSNVSNIIFPSPLNYCILPETYEPNKPLYFSAMNSSEEDVSINVYDIAGNTVWSQIYSGSNIFGSIPASITRQNEIDYVSFDKSGEELFDSGGGISIMMITDPVEPPLGDVQALIILPNFQIRIYDRRSISQVQESLAANGITYKKLRGRFATYDNVAWYAANKNIKYMYIDAHGNYKLVENGVLRTVIKLYDVPVVSIKQTDFAPGYAPSWCQRLEGNLENLPSFYAMGFDSLEFAYFDCCYSGRLKINGSNQLVEGQPGQIGLFDGPHSDMSLALGIGDTGRSRVYQGWFEEVPIRLWSETEYQKWTRLEWEYLGEGYDLYWALMYVINEQTDFGPHAPVNNYRLKGQGLLTDITLSRW